MWWLIPKTSWADCNTVCDLGKNLRLQWILTYYNFITLKRKATKNFLTILKTLSDRDIHNPTEQQTWCAAVFKSCRSEQEEWGNNRMKHFLEKSVRQDEKPYMFCSCCTPISSLGPLWQTSGNAWSRSFSPVELLSLFLHSKLGNIWILQEKNKPTNWDFPCNPNMKKTTNRLTIFFFYLNTWAFTSQFVI